MSRLLLAGPLALALAAPGALACGDKVLRIGRGSRFERGYVALHPAAVLVYANSASKVGKAMADLQPALKSAGHRPTVVRAARDLGEAARSAKYDVVLADEADVAGVKRELSSLGATPRILPVFNKPSKEAAAQAEERHGCIVVDPGRRSEVLVKIDQLLDEAGK